MHFWCIGELSLWLSIPVTYWVTSVLLRVVIIVKRIRIFNKSKNDKVKCCQEDRHHLT